MKTSAFLYPWDVIGDPDAPARIADLGVSQVTLASAYHSTRALTPRHPGHRIVTAEHAAVLYPMAELHWSGAELRPYAAGAWAPGDAFGRAAEALAAAGLDIHSWVVLAHNSRLGAEHPGTSVVNAYGDRYPWAPCIAQPRVRAFLVALAAEAAVRPGALGVELESCGWYGLAHPHAHDKVAGVALDDTAQYLMSLCFCPSCGQGYEELGLCAEELKARVRRALEPVWRGGEVGAAGAGLLAATLGFRTGVARALQEAVVTAVRARAGAGFQVLLHADPRASRCGANVGVDAEHVLGVADGVVVPCSGGPELLEPFAAVGAPSPAAVLAANLTVVSGMGGRPLALADDVARVVASGATELRLYHAGLASDEDLEAVRRSGVAG
ncbi:hypothetical protein [Streptomyces sp. MBT27]|uniref:hypothetical protein n=1 Tax=Streptomyces sp. MBT27 TaxID=1488356 RepID=UPI00141E735A|nr:hypothetical protein [Streptomyces sp. MBT27]